MARPLARRGAVIVALALLSALAGVRADCPVSYGGSSKALLFGGLHDASCTVQRSGMACPFRSPKWRDMCRYDPSAVKFPVCSADQAKASLELATKLHGGEPLRLSPCDLYPYLRGRTLWILGDSHGKQLFRALQCFMVDMWPGQTECKVSNSTELVARLDKLPMMPGESKCIHLLGNGRVCYVGVVLGTSLLDNPQVAENGVLNLLRREVADPRDIFLIQFGPWHNKLGPPGMEAHSRALQVLGEDYERNRWRWPHVIWRETPMTHDKDTLTKTCRPAPAGWTYDAANGRLQVAEAARSAAGALLARGGGINAPAHEILGRYGVPIMGGFAYSVPLHSAHIGLRGVSELDCLHYCSYGLPEIFLYELTRSLKNGMAGVQQLNWVAPSERLPCTPLK
ncbi:hypothetical protein Rsub_09120 [Raphidocelis subcapitata]|uniref:SGNH hydrolase-type esterase domain-containing protein n=1 Tax=Raphidocelis subcapitata TaxID=307507 RepID=A0A2V0PH53_9CHLO|nr:hypothetical protein Rsub_09120 [Raphidocelis subcapitata]|eukprot:GBF96537.1 hypothetical protein Rsub_09120 [Raphidocelis subcapitata]